MISQFHDQVMTPWVKVANFEGIDSKSARLNEMKSFLNLKKVNLTKSEFTINWFCVSRATIDILGEITLDHKL
ncbi:MAG: hypothetical protein RCG15_03535 [Candidatus Rickettsia vulgarisii]